MFNYVHHSNNININKNYKISSITIEHVNNNNNDESYNDVIGDVSDKTNIDYNEW